MKLTIEITAKERNAIQRALKSQAAVWGRAATTRSGYPQLAKEAAYADQAAQELARLAEMVGKWKR